MIIFVYDKTFEGLLTAVLMPIPVELFRIC